MPPSRSWSQASLPKAHNLSTEVETRNSIGGGYRVDESSPMSSIFGLGGDGSKWKAAEKTVLASIDIARENPRLALDLLRPIVKKVTEEPSLDQRYLDLRATTFRVFAFAHYHFGAYAEAEQLYRENLRDWRTAEANNLDELVKRIVQNNEMIAHCIFSQGDSKRFSEFVDTSLQWRTEQVRAAEQRDRPRLLLEIAFQYQFAGSACFAMEPLEGDDTYALKFSKMENGILTALLPTLSGRTLEATQTRLAELQTFIEMLESPKLKSLRETFAAYKVATATFDYGNDPTAG